MSPPFSRGLYVPAEKKHHENGMFEGKYRKGYGVLDHVNSGLCDCLWRWGTGGLRFHALSRMKTARIFVISPFDIFRAGVRTIADEEPDLDIVGDAAKLPIAVRSIEQAEPDLIICDLQDYGLAHELPALLDSIRALAPKGIVVTSTASDYELSQCIQHEMDGIVNRNVARTEMVAAIRKVLSGRAYRCSCTLANLKKDRVSQPLTKRELEVLQFLALGLGNKEIAERLSVGVGTIKTHLININLKLAVTTRTEAVIRGLQQRLISI